MNRGQTIYFIAYDISSNKKRNHIVKVLSDYGIRIQKSIFRCILGKEQMNALMYKLNQVIKRSYDDGNFDSIIIFEDVKLENTKIIQGNFMVSEEAYHII